MGHFTTIYKLKIFAQNPALYSGHYFNSLNEKVFFKRSPYTLEDKELLKISMLPSHKGKLEGYHIYYGGVASRAELYTQEKISHGVKIMLGNQSHL